MSETPERVPHPRQVRGRAPATMKAAERLAKALNLRRAGASYEQIARECGWASKGTAHRAITAAMAKQATETAESAEAMRAMEGERLDALQMQMWKLAMAKETDDATRMAAVDRLVRIMERRARLYGLDLPVDLRVRLEEGQLDFLEDAVRALLDGIQAALASAGLEQAVAPIWQQTILGEVVPRALAAAAEGAA